MKNEQRTKPNGIPKTNTHTHTYALLVVSVKMKRTKKKNRRKSQDMNYMRKVFQTNAIWMKFELQWQIFSQPYTRTIPSSNHGLRLFIFIFSAGNNATEIDRYARGMPSNSLNKILRKKFNCSTEAFTI